MGTIAPKTPVWRGLGVLADWVRLYLPCTPKSPGDIYYICVTARHLAVLAATRPPTYFLRICASGRTAQGTSITLVSPTAFTVPCTVTLSYYYYITVHVGYTPCAVTRG